MKARRGWAWLCAAGAGWWVVLESVGGAGREPFVIKDFNHYLARARAEPALRLVDLAEHVPGVQLDLRYATPYNFTLEPLYEVSRGFLCFPAAERLKGVVAELRKQGLGLKIYDAYRPYRVTQQMWRSRRAPEGFLAAPRAGSDHNRGAALDVTLFDLKTGAELKMPTAFDDFSVRAHHDFTAISAEEWKNRALLRETMERHGFTALSTEWWHYAFSGSERFELLDIPLKTMAAYEDSKQRLRALGEAHRALIQNQAD